MMMSEINDADRRLLVCVAVAMEPEPWGMRWGRGLQDPLQPFVGRGAGKELQAGIEGWISCYLLSPKTGSVGPTLRKW